MILGDVRLKVTCAGEAALYLPGAAVFTALYAGEVLPALLPVADRAPEAEAAPSSGPVMLISGESSVSCLDHQYSIKLSCQYKAASAQRDRASAFRSR